MAIIPAPTTANLVATVADPIQYLINELDLSALTRRLGSTHPTLDIGLLVREYRRFLALKYAHRDEHARLLSPSPLVDQAWHEHILDTRSYIGMCLAIGLWIHHDPDGASANDAAGRKRRRENTIDLYQARFGAMDLRVWDMEGVMRPFAMPQLNVTRIPEDLKTESAALQSGAKQQDQPSDRIVLHLRDQSGSEIEVKVRPWTTFDKVARLYAEKKGLDLEELRFDFDGARLDPEWARSMVELDLRDGDFIDVSTNQCGC